MMWLLTWLVARTGSTSSHIIVVRGGPASGDGCLGAAISVWSPSDAWVSASAAGTARHHALAIAASVAPVIGVRRTALGGTGRRTRFVAHMPLDRSSAQPRDLLMPPGAAGARRRQTSAAVAMNAM